MSDLRKAAEMALEALDMESQDFDGLSWSRTAKLIAAGVALKEAMAQPERRCEAGVSLQDLWDCWDAVHGGQEPVGIVSVDAYSTRTQWWDGERLRGWTTPDGAPSEE